MQYHIPEIATIFYPRLQELLKLKKKITTTVEVLTHVKEKLQFVQAENQVTKAQLREVEEEVAKVSHLNAYY